MRRSALAVLVAAAAAAAPAAAVAAPAPRIRVVRCVPASACQDKVRVHAGDSVRLYGRRLGGQARLRSHGRLSTTRVRRARAGWLLRVPRRAHPGATRLVVHHGRRHSNPVRLRVLRRVRAHVPAPAPTPVPSPSGPLPAAFAGNGMWIWQLDRSSAGDPAAIAAQARAAGIGTVFVKAGDGTSQWPQFNATLVAALHAAGLRACAWQYVYGAVPQAEAAVGAAAVAAGADCLVIDAETEYQGRYAAAQTYMTDLRAAVGPDYPVGLTSFPYVDYHPALPYSVFLGPGGAQANLPQVYWHTIGGSVDAVSAHTWEHNRLYGAPIAPLGQTYGAPPLGDLGRFRTLWGDYGAGGVSWWDWQETTPTQWSALATVPPGALPPVDPGWPALGRGSEGDQVVWLQEHLASGDAAVVVDGDFGPITQAAVQAVQTAHALPATGVMDPATWQAVLAQPMIVPDWTAPAATGAGAHAARARPRAPRSARLPARGYEIRVRGRGGR